MDAHDLPAPNNVMEPGAAIRDGTHSTTINLGGYQYTRAWSSQRKVAYRCSVYRSTGCRGKVEFVAATMQYMNFEEHSCRRDAVVVPETTDITSAMQAAVDELALGDLAMSAMLIWHQVDAQFYQSDTVVALRGLTQHQVLGRVYRSRARHFGGNIHGRIEVPPLSRVRGQPLNFFQFHLISNNGGGPSPQRIIGWAHPHLVALLKYTGTTLFVDGTFRSVPRGFKQCVIVMVHDRASGFYVPVFFILTTARTSDTYWDVFNLIIQATDQQIEPAEVVCDFEAGLIGAVQVQFPNADVLGCLFHFKQAVRRRMRRLTISEPATRVAMERGMLDMLTVIPPDEVATTGIAWVKTQIKARCRTLGIPYSRNNWRSFWAYFRRTWIDRFPPDVWNVHGMSNRIVARTNNPLERFNRELNAAFATPHPNMATFVSTIE